MKNRLIIAVALVIGILRFPAQADEGMWLPYALQNQTLAQMQALGCKLTAEQIFSLNQPSVKDAIVQFGNGCTGELISGQGLLLTNHHCGLGQIQSHSSVEHDYLTDGFWAKSRNEELPNPGLNVSFLNYVEDVTAKVLKGTEEAGNQEIYNDMVAENIKKTVQDRKQGRNVRVEIVPFYNGNQFIMFEYNVYDDVRLVACPPWGIGKYGADTDNWTWPRHKGDFCIFRVYCAPDGSPAAYSKKNVPMVPKHFLKINPHGVNDGDYAMILGYPGSTDRYSTSFMVKNIIDNDAPALIKCRTTKLNQYRKHMDANQEVFIKYASKQAGVSNYWKYYIGQVRQLKHNKVYDSRLEQEEEFRNWVNAKDSRYDLYGDVFNGIERKWEIVSGVQKSMTIHREAGWNGGEAVAFARRFRSIENMFANKASKSEIASAALDMKDKVNAFFKDYDADLDKDVTIALLNLFYEEVDNSQLPTMLADLGKKNNGDFKAYVENLFKKSIFVSQDKMNKWIESPKSLKKDPIYALSENIIESYNKLAVKYEQAETLGETSERNYMKGLKEMLEYKGATLYPDANFTMRLTYGQVKPYVAADAVYYNYYTTMDGVMEKYVPGNWEFDIPKNVRQLQYKRDYGRYADEYGQLRVNFITTNDITGGNSGSPVLDGDGNLIGLAFDGNWEAMSGDLKFENEVQRTICVEARYLLWCIEKVGKAQNLMNELVIID